MLTRLYNLFWREYSGCITDMYDEETINQLKGMLTDIIENKAKPFLQWLIDNGHIEEIKSTKKSGPDMNDYIKYIAETEDPMKTLVDLLK